MEKQQFTAINQVMNPWYRTFSATINHIQQLINQSEPQQGFAGLGSLFSDEPQAPVPLEPWDISEWQKHMSSDIELFIVSLTYPVPVVYAYALNFDKHNYLNGSYDELQLDKLLKFSDTDEQVEQLSTLILGYAIDDCDWPTDVFVKDITTHDYFSKDDKPFEGLGSLFG